MKLQSSSFSEGDIILPTTSPKPTCKFGEDATQASIIDGSVIEQIRADIGRIKIPSWMKRPPRNFGQASHGKLTADQWRTLCTVVLVVTLIPLWQSPSVQPVLNNNYLDLVTAIRWATMRATSEKHIQILEAHLTRYLETTVSLYSKSVICPNHHLSLHLPECIRNFGPVHGWWSFPFERYNGILQRINNNGKLG
jgi:hypothetical protein